VAGNSRRSDHGAGRSGLHQPWRNPATNHERVAGGVPDLPGPVRPDPNGTGVQGIFVIDLSGSHERQIQPPRGGRFPDWSPDGKRRTFSSQRDQPLPTWYLINPDGTDIHPLPQLQGAGDPIDWLTPVG
jgi:hypothetical protein